MAKVAEIDLNWTTSLNMASKEESRELSRKSMVQYKKLVIPNRMRSIYWKFFGFPADEDLRIITRQKIVCTLCKTQMTYNQNTSNLRMHLVSKHRSAIQKIEPDIDIKAVIESSRGRKYKMKQGDGRINKTVNDVVTPSKKMKKDVEVLVQDVNDSDISNIAIIFPNDEVNASAEYADVREVDDSFAQFEFSEITEAVVNFIVSDLISPSIVEGKGFLNLLTNLSGKKVNVLSEQKLISEHLPAIYNSCKEQLFTTITSNCITNIALSIEEWCSVDNIKCVSIYMHYLQNGEPCLFTKLLTTVFSTDSECIAYWDSILMKLFNDWSINSNAVTAILVSSSNDELKTALRNNGFVVISCFLFVVQELCSKHCFTHSVVSEVLSKCRRVIKFIQDMKIEIEDDSEQEVEEDENDFTSLIFDSPDLWLTSYYMLRSLYKRKNNIAAFLNGLNTLPDDITVSHREWQSIFDILVLLEPLKTIVVTLLEEKNSLISLLKPLIWQVNSSKFDSALDDSQAIKELKSIIKEVLNEAYADENVDNLTQIATTLDPRFKSFMQQDDNYNSRENLTELLTHLIHNEGSLSPNDSLGQSPEKSFSKKSGRSSINALFGNFRMNKPTLSLEGRVKVEVSHYQNEGNALLEECPLEWWQLMRNKCPNLSRLALKYHCVPAVVTWYSGGRTFKDYCSTYRKRSQLKTNVIDSMLFLYSNKFT